MTTIGKISSRSFQRQFIYAYLHMGQKTLLFAVKLWLTIGLNYVTSMLWGTNWKYYDLEDSFANNHHLGNPYLKRVKLELNSIYIQTVFTLNVSTISHVKTLYTVRYNFFDMAVCWHLKCKHCCIYNECKHSIFHLENPKNLLCGNSACNGEVHYMGIYWFNLEMQLSNWMILVWCG